MARRRKSDTSVALQSYTRTIGDGPRNFEPRSNCDGYIRDSSTNPHGKSLGYQFALVTTNPFEEENRDIQISGEDINSNQVRLSLAGIIFGLL
ncbi:hypothetical protein TNCV_3624201 [Trichonephila clavipes]|nr:hypothetical protein TNCV_3624201 [Trichonephila clavipes]